MRACVCLTHRHSPHASPAQAKGVSVNEKENGGVTALIVAAREGHKEVAEFLLVRGAWTGGMFISVQRCESWCIACARGE